MKELTLNPLGMAAILLARIFLGSLCLCGGIHVLGCKNFTPFFSWKRVARFFLLTFGLRLLIDAIFSFAIA